MPLTTELIDRVQRENFDINTYIETGTGSCASLGMAKRHFENLYTIDIKDFRKSAESNGAKFCHGNSITELPKILSEVKERAVIYLDAHIICNEGKDLPLMQELEIINSHFIKTHVIIIDDIRLLYRMKLNKQDLEKKILSIKPDYTIEYIDDGVAHGDLLFAYV